MLKNKIRNYQIFSFVFTGILGSFLHFTYELSGENKLVAVFSSVNESTWEHLKLLFFPMLLTIIIGYFYFEKKQPNFICSKTVGILVAITFTVVFFYTYTGILGKNISALDILSFFIASALGEFTSYVLMINKFKCDTLISILVLILLSICFTVFTYYPPKIGLFKDPVASLKRSYKTSS